MRRFACAFTLALLALAPPDTTGHTQAYPDGTSASQPVFGPSVRLRDPSRYPADDRQYARQPLPDAEPSVAVAPDGAVWVATLHERHGTALWRGHIGQAPPAFVGQPDAGIGGGDVALALGVDRSISGGATIPLTSTTGITGITIPRAPASLYVAALAPIGTPATAWRIAATSCPRGEIARAFRACVFYPHLAYGRRDRPWLATYGRSTVYLSYLTRGDDLLSGHVTVRRSDDGGATWHSGGDPVAGITAEAPAPVHGWSGNLAVDGRDGTVYEIFVAGTPGQEDGDRFNRLVLARSRDGGATWRDLPVYQGRAGEDDANMWPGLAVDAAGRLYAAWSDRRGVLLSSSPDGGETWSPAQRVDTSIAGGAGLRSNVLPSVAAGPAGRVALAWYGADARDNLSPAARWRVYAATSSDGGATFGGAAATDVAHEGPICAKGDACDELQRQLLDNLGLALDPRTGRAVIAYGRSVEFGDYRACRRAANCPQTYYVEQVAP